MYGNRHLTVYNIIVSYAKFIKFNMHGNQWVFVNNQAWHILMCFWVATCIKLFNTIQSS